VGGHFPVVERVDAGPLDGCLHEEVHAVRAKAPADGLVARRDRPEDRAWPMPASSAQVRRDRTGQRAGLGPMGMTTSSGSVPSWLVLERGMVTTRPWGWSSRARSRAPPARSAAGRRRSPRATGPCPGRRRGQAQLGGREWLRSWFLGRPPGRRATLGHERGRLVGRGTVGTADTLPHGHHPGGPGRVREPRIRKAKRMADRRLGTDARLGPGRRCVGC
jgi:hypothetical protein